MSLAGTGAPSLLRGTTDLGAVLERIYRQGELQEAMPAVELEPLARPALAGAPWLLWLLLGVVTVVVLTVWLSNVNWERLGERRTSRDAPTAATAERGHEAAELAAADALARQGRYAQAVHALLLGVLRALAVAKPWPPAATPREIAATHMPVEDLRVLVSVAELAHFGGRPASQADYLACRARALRLRPGDARQGRQPSSWS